MADPTTWNERLYENIHLSNLISNELRNGLPNPIVMMGNSKQVSHLNNSLLLNDYYEYSVLQGLYYWLYAGCK